MAFSFGFEWPFEGECELHRYVIGVNIETRLKS